MYKQISRLFSNQSYYDKLAALQPFILAPRPHPGFSTSFMLSSLPILAGGISTAMFPHFNLFLSSVSDIALYTCLYSGLQTTFFAGVHLGFGSVLHDSETNNDDTKYIDLQLVCPFLAPV